MPSTHDQLLQTVNQYEMPSYAKELLVNHPPLLLCGITSAGKDYMANKLVADGGYEIVVSHTTRLPRENHESLEQSGVHYFFVDESTMLDLAKNEAFIEVKAVHSSGDTYGSSIEAYNRPLNNGNIPILVVDFQGAEEINDVVESLRPIFLLPPTFEVWQERLTKRGKPDAETLKRRLNTALLEIDHVMANPRFQLVVNVEGSLTADFIRRGIIGRDHSAVEVADRLVFDIKKNLEKLN